MKTAEEMLKWFKIVRKINRSQLSDTLSRGLFEQIEEGLDTEEKIHIAFIGSEGEKSTFWYMPWDFYGKLSAIAITDKGILVATKVGILFPRKKVKTIKLEYLNDISKEDRLIFSTINIDTIKETINITLRKQDTKELFTLLRKKIMEIKEKTDSENTSERVMIMKEYNQNNSNN